MAAGVTFFLRGFLPASLAAAISDGDGGDSLRLSGTRVRCNPSLWTPSE